MLQNRIRFHVRKSGVRAPVATVVTQVVVDKDDPDFHQPSKPVGPFYSEEAARRLEQEGKGDLVKEVKPKSKQEWRRIVPSPMPQDIFEKTSIRSLLSAGMVVVASGGGIPVYSDEAGDHIGVDAGIDKDRAAVCLAELVEADRFIIPTDVPNLLLNYNTAEQQTLETVSLREMDEYIA